LTGARASAAGAARAEPLEAILFDAGNTLLFLDYERLAPAVGAAVGHPLTPDGLAAVAGEAARRLERGAGTEKERATLFLEGLFLLAGCPEASLPGVRDALYRLHMERHLWSAVESRTHAALDRLRALGVKLGVVSNSDGRAEEALRAAGLLDYFDLVLDSAHVGVEKPDPRIFQIALDRLGVPAGAALYAGDIYEVDVVGARAAGLDVVLIDPRGEHRGRDVDGYPSVGTLFDHLLAAGRLPAAPAPNDGGSR
jgi:putative hydrolase of the HAD superfamily